MEPKFPTNLAAQEAAQRFAEIANWFDQRQSTTQAKDTDSMHAAAYAMTAYLSDISSQLRRIAATLVTISNTLDR